MQNIDRSIIEPLLESFELNLNKGLMQLIEKHVFTKTFGEYIKKVSESKDHEVARRAKTVVFEINRYDGSGEGIDVFPEF
jgi:hypothetical protein